METSTATLEAPSSPPTPQATVSESEFLQQQADEAKAALAATLADAAAALKQGVDPVTWARRYPLVAIGSALLAGFAAAAVTVPSKEQQELKKLEKLARALRPASAPAAVGSAEKAAPAPAAEPAKSIWMTVLHEAINLLRPALVSMLSAYLGSHRATPEPTNGHPGPSGAAGTDSEAAAS